MEYYFTAQKLAVGYDNRPLIENIDFSLKRGEILTLIGPNGAGKSTILKSIARQLSLVSGTIYLDKSDVVTMNGNEFAKKMAVVLTDKLKTELMTCYDVVATGRYPYTGRFGVLSDEDKKAVDEAMELVNKGINPITFPGLKLSITSEESKSINFDDRPKVIISASGMCDAGRIKHHLKHNLWRPECTVLFVGYQAIGTPGRALVEGAKEIKLFGEEIQVNAEIKVLPGVSGHADNEGLMEWAKAFEEKPKQVFVCHGEDTSCQVLTGRLEDELHYTAMAPYSGTVYDLKEAAFISCPEGVVIRKQETKPQ